MNRDDHNRIIEASNVPEIFQRIRLHPFHPLNDEQSLTIDQYHNTAGIVDLDNEDWSMRLLAIRDLVRAGTESTSQIINGLFDDSIHVRQLSAMALGILRAKTAVSELERVVSEDVNAMVRSQALISLGQMESEQSLELIRKRQKIDPSRDVRHQCELSIDQIEKKMGATEKLLSAYLSIDASAFKSVRVGELAPGFELDDTEGNRWTLDQFQNKRWVVLIWIFADWCPVCHGEFHDLIEQREQFEKAGIQVFTVEIHDTYRGRVMVGQELEPEYWFAKESFKQAYTDKIWWPHLLDRAGVYASIYGADPYAFCVHGEYINRPSTVIIDNQGKVRLAYSGRYWGDRPTIDQTIQMIKSDEFTFDSPERKDKK
ncbi:MAG: redoxin domain-containing protein [Bacillota bacterium]|nr:redoxin domain-containing protein [Bacillota bacterium]